MKSDASNLYVLADGTHGDPAECKADDKGVMRHANGVPVALKADGKPLTVGDQAVEGYNESAAKAADGEPVKPIGVPDHSAPPAPARADRRPVGIMTTADVRPAPAPAPQPAQPQPQPQPAAPREQPKV